MKCLIFAFLGLAMMSCSRVSSSKVDQSSWRATYSLEQQGDKIVCTAKYQVGGSTGTYLELSEDEEGVYCQDKLMIRSDALFGEVVYRAEVKSATNENYQIRLSRKDKQYLAQVRLPEPIHIVAPTYNQILPKNKAFEVIWDSQSGTKMDVSLNFKKEKESVFNLKSLSKDQGRVTFDASDTPQVLGTTTDGTMAEVSLTRSTSGEMPIDLNGGINAYQRSSATVFFK